MASGGVVRRDECVAWNPWLPAYIVYHPDIEPAFLLVVPDCRAYALAVPVRDGDYYSAEVVDAAASAPRRLVEEGVVVRGCLVGLLYALSVDEYRVMRGFRVCFEGGCDAHVIQSLSVYVLLARLKRTRLPLDELADQVEKLVYIVAHVASVPLKHDFVVGSTGPESGIARLTVYTAGLAVARGDARLVAFTAGV